MSLVEKFNKKTGFATEGEQIQQLPLIKIKPDPDQPRKHFNEVGLKELGDSIKENGVENPITVRFVGTEEDEEYIILTGERRYRASELAGLTHIRAIVKRDDINESTIRIKQLTENLQREDLGTFEVARGFQGLKELGMKQREIARSLGIREDKISKHLSILNTKKIPQKWLEELEKHCYNAPLFRLLEIAQTKNARKRKVLCEKLIEEYAESEVELEEEEEESKETRKKAGKEYDVDEVWEAFKWVSKKDRTKLVELFSAKALDKLLEMYASKQI